VAIPTELPGQHDSVYRYCKQTTQRVFGLAFNNWVIRGNYGIYLKIQTGVQKSQDQDIEQIFCNTPNFWKQLEMRVWVNLSLEAVTLSNNAAYGPKENG